MTSVFAQFTSRWDNRSRQSYDDAVCWHLLLGGDAAARAAASAARQRLARFAGLHMTPPQWLHVTVLRIGTADLVTQDEMSRMLVRAQAELARTAPVTVALRRRRRRPGRMGAAPDALLQHDGAGRRASDRRARQDAAGLRGDDRRDEPCRPGRSRETVELAHCRERPLARQRVRYEVLTADFPQGKRPGKIEETHKSTRSASPQNSHKFEFLGVTD